MEELTYLAMYCVCSSQLEGSEVVVPVVILCSSGFAILQHCTSESGILVAVRSVHFSSLMHIFIVGGTN